MLANQSFRDAAALRLLDAVRDPIRLEIIFLLARSGRLNVGEVASRFRQSRPAISHHLKVLKDAGAVLNEKVGQEMYYWVDRQRIVGALRSVADAIEGCCPVE